MSTSGNPNEGNGICSPEANEHLPRVCIYPLRFRGQFRSQDLITALGELGNSGINVRPVECVDYAQQRSKTLKAFTRGHFDWLVFGRKLTHQEIAASLSHRKAWIEAFTDDCEWAVFLEDDVVPRTVRFKNYCEALASISTSRPMSINMAPAERIRASARSRKRMEEIGLANT